MTAVFGRWVAARTLRLRLIVIAALAIAIALVAAGTLLSRIFATHIEAREWAELRNHANQLIALLEVTNSRDVQLTANPADPRFDLPGSGLYWQVDTAAGQRLRSRSLWDTELKLPHGRIQSGDVHRHDIAGPNGVRLTAHEAAVVIGPANDPQSLIVAVAVDRREIEEAVASFRKTLLQSLATLGACLIGALYWQVWLGLRPLDRLRRDLASVHEGAVSKIDGTYVGEIDPLVQDLNVLLDRERRERERARERAADLAHGFKTPLSIQAAIARDLRREGRDALAIELETQVDMMERHVRRELSRVRTVGGAAIGQRTTAVRPVIDDVLSTLQRVIDERHVVWTVECPADVGFNGDANDLLELLGNLCENATKWASSRAKVDVTLRDKHVVIRIDDDGRGLPEGGGADFPSRGVRLDERQSGHGIGLSIVSKIVEAYAGEMKFERSSIGGLSVKVKLLGGRFEPPGYSIDKPSAPTSR